MMKSIRALLAVALVVVTALLLIALPGVAQEDPEPTLVDPLTGVQGEGLVAPDSADGDTAEVPLQAATPTPLQPGVVITRPPSPTPPPQPGQVITRVPTDEPEPTAQPGQVITRIPTDEPEPTAQPGQVITRIPTDVPAQAAPAQTSPTAPTAGGVIPPTPILFDFSQQPAVEDFTPPEALAPAEPTAAPTAAPAPSAEVVTLDQSGTVTALVNLQRESFGAGALTEDARLERAAAAYAAELAATGVPNQGVVPAQLAAAGYDASELGVIVLIRPDTDAGSAINQGALDVTTYNNLISPIYTDIGVGTSVAPNGVTFYVIVLGRTPAAGDLQFDFSN